MLSDARLARGTIFLALSALAAAGAALAGVTRAPAQTVARRHVQSVRYSNIGAFPGGIAPGPEGNLWFTVSAEEGEGAAIGMINPTTHAIAEYSSGLKRDAAPNDITAGPEGELWFTDVARPAIGTINPRTHTIKEYSGGLKGAGESEPNDITTGPEGNLWFTDEIGGPGVVNPKTHAIKEYSAGSIISPLEAIAAGPEGNLWFTTDSAIGMINPTTHAAEDYSSGLNRYAEPSDIAAGPEGNLWFTDAGALKGIGTPAIGMIDPATHTISEYSVGLDRGATLNSIAAGPEGDLWFTDDGTTPAIGVINPTTDAISEYSAGLNNDAQPFAIAAGPEGNLWFTDRGPTRAIGMINPTTHAISEYSAGLAQPRPARVSCKASAKQLSSDRVLVAYRCEGIMVDRMEIHSNRTITSAYAKEEITTCERRSGDRVVVCVEAGITSEVTEPSAAIIGVSGPLCGGNGRLQLSMLLTGRNGTEFEEPAKAEPAVKGPCPTGRLRGYSEPPHTKSEPPHTKLTTDSSRRPRTR